MRENEDCCAKSNQNRRRGKKNSPNRRNNRVNGSQQGPQSLTRIPIRSNPTIPIRRATTRTLLCTYGATDGYAFNDVQLAFAPGSTNYRIGGTSIYSDALPNNAEFSNLFDQYRIKSVIVRMDCPDAWANSAPTPTQPVFLPLVYYALDYDDPGSALKNNLLEYPQVNIHSFYTNGYKPLILKFSPKPLVDIAGSGIATAYGPMQKAPWIRTSEMTVPHYGLKMFFEFPSSTQINTIQISYTIWYDLEFTNPK